MLGGANYVSVSGVVDGEPTDEQDGRAQFPLRVETGDDPRAMELAVQVIAAGRRARRVMRSARPGRRVSVWGKLLPVGQTIGVWADWVEFGSTDRQEGP